MRYVLGVDPESHTSNWDALIKNYWDSLSVIVPRGGKILDIGFKYDIRSTDNIQSKHISELLKGNKDIKTDKDLGDYVEASIAEESKYRYGLPTNSEDYMLWRYCQHYGYVANSIQDVDNAPKKIKFYLYSEAEKKIHIQEHHNLKVKAMTKYIEVVKDKKMVDAILILIGKGFEVDGMEVFEKEQAIDTLHMNDPQKFLKLASDKHLLLKADIEGLINRNILQRLPNTQIVTAANNIEKVIGHSMDECITYFLDPKNKPEVTEYMVIYKQSKKE